MKPLAVSVEEAALALGVSKHTLRKYIREGRVEAVHLGRRILVPVGVLEKLAREGLPNAPSVTSLGEL